MARPDLVVRGIRVVSNVCAQGLQSTAASTGWLQMNDVVTEYAAPERADSTRAALMGQRREAGARGGAESGAESGAERRC